MKLGELDVKHYVRMFGTKMWTKLQRCLFWTFCFGDYDM